MVKIAFERESPNTLRIKDSTIGVEIVRHMRSSRLAGGQGHVGDRLCRGKHVVFCHCDWICKGVGPAEGEGDAEEIATLALGLVKLALRVYLVYPLLHRQKF